METITAERQTELQKAIQRLYDKDNFEGLTPKERSMKIAANLELLKSGIVFVPEYNCPA